MTSPPEKASPSKRPDEALADFSARCDAIEEAYEFMLAYAAQGLPAEEGSTAGGQIREFLQRCEAALAGLWRGGEGQCPPARPSIARALRRVHQRR